ncbi:hypothetical protein NM208_g6304 [Fusarium decemcellulare]|uniref:Uncharacterized protein n=1 Tax=Fusarium decemcellulare TaxID=57161 RepID=A0ACC1SDH6_9HYPO|nr:hypothetical protein NM208_g6304 [Fusarium decemcellulare]
MRIPQFLRRALVALPLFNPWDKSQWTASDDTVRGGKSRSYLDVLKPHTNENPFKESIIKFYGHLDYETLGGAGFASQRTVDDWPGLDLSEYDSIILEIPYTDGKKYSFNLKDTVLPDVDGREQATISWEYDFQLPATYSSQASDSVESVIVKFSDLQPTYRGTVQNDTAPLDLSSIKRVNIMIRSFFAEQEGDFELRIKSIKAVQANPYVEVVGAVVEVVDGEEDEEDEEVVEDVVVVVAMAQQVMAIMTIQEVRTVIAVATTQQVVAIQEVQNGGRGGYGATGHSHYGHPGGQNGAFPGYQAGPPMGMNPGYGRGYDPGYGSEYNQGYYPGPPQEWNQPPGFGPTWRWVPGHYEFTGPAWSNEQDVPQWPQHAPQRGRDNGHRANPRFEEASVSTEQDRPKKKPKNMVKSSKASLVKNHGEASIVKDTSIFELLGRDSYAFSTRTPEEAEEVAELVRSIDKGHGVEGFFKSRSKPSTMFTRRRRKAGGISGDLSNVFSGQRTLPAPESNEAGKNDDVPMTEGQETASGQTVVPQEAQDVTLDDTDPIPQQQDASLEEVTEPRYEIGSCGNCGRDDHPVSEC